MLLSLGIILGNLLPVVRRAPKTAMYKIAFQYDAYCPLVARISQHVLRWGGACSRGCLLLGGACSQGGACILSQGGACLWSQGVCIQACNGADPPVNRITDTCKNINLPQLRCGR